MLRRGKPVLAWLLLAGCCASVLAQDGAPRPEAVGTDRFLVCYPNAPGTPRQAEPVMAKLGEYLGDRLGRRVRPSYFNELSAAEAWLAQEPARYGIVTLDLYLRWHRSKRLTVLAHAERSGASTERYHLLVPKAGPEQELADLLKLPRAPRIWSSHLDDPRFAGRVVFQGRLTVKEVQREEKVIPALTTGQVRVVSTTKTLGAVRRMLAGQPYLGQPVDAVLVDDTAWAGLQKLSRFKDVLRVLYASPALPTPVVVSLGDVPAAEAERLGKVVVAMKQEQEGQAILSTLQATGFSAPQRDALAALVKTYAEEPGAAKGESGEGSR
ncbi:MAG: phosphate/phosphite/phosphonate ABC transporter substrate-binding protein [Planctomycetota bacterium]